MQITLQTLDSDRITSLFEGLRDLPAVATTATLRAVERGSLRLLKVASKERFTGKGPFPPRMKRLGVRTGLLRRSLRATKPTVAGGRVVVELGASAKYWAAHEFGGALNVKAHTRKVKSRDIFEKNARIGSGVAQVKAHTRRLPARKPLGTAIDEHAEDIYTEEIIAELTRELDDRAKGGRA